MRKTIHSYKVLLPVCGLLLAGCATTKQKSAAAPGSAEQTIVNKASGAVSLADVQTGVWIDIGAVETAPGAKSAAAKARPAGPYKLGIGDVLNISIYGEADSARSVPVDPTGHITYLLVGRVPAAGRTLDELRVELQKRIDKQLNDVLISLVPQQLNSQSYTLLGMLNAPSVYPLQGRTYLLDAISAGGGLRTGLYRNSTADLADLNRASLVRGGRLVPVDFAKLIHQGDASQNVEVLPSDVIYIPSAVENKVYALGEFNAPRSIEYVDASITLIDLIIEAQGLVSYGADGRVLIVRGNQRNPKIMVVNTDGITATKINTKKILKGKGLNTVLQPGDIVYAPPRRFDFIRSLAEDAVRAFTLSVAFESGQYLYIDSDPLNTGRGKNDNNFIVIP